MNLFSNSNIQPLIYQANTRHLMGLWVKHAKKKKKKTMHTTKNRICKQSLTLIQEMQHFCYI